MVQGNGNIGKVRGVAGAKQRRAKAVPIVAPVLTDGPTDEEAIPAVLRAPDADVPAEAMPVVEDMSIPSIDPAPAEQAGVVDAPASTPSAADPAVSTSEEHTMATTFENAAGTAQDQFTTGAKDALADMSARAKAAMEKSGAALEEMNSFAKGNVEAIVESSKIYARGLESFGQDAAAFAKKSFEDATAAFKAMSTVKSPTEFFKLHSDFSRSAFDAAVAETSKSTEKMIKLAGDVAQPISNRVALAAEKAKVVA